MTNAPPKMHANNKRPETALAWILDDCTGSGAAWAKGIEKTSLQLVRELEAKFSCVKFSYVAMHDQEEGEEDEYRLQDGTGADFLREQAAMVRTGGGDPAETFAQTAEDLLSNPIFLPDSGPTEARGVIMFTTSDTKPAENNTLEELGAEFKQRRIRLYVVGTPGTNMEDLAKAAGGYFFALSNNPSDSEVAQIASTLAATVTGTLRTGATVRKTVRGETVAAP